MKLRKGIAGTRAICDVCGALADETGSAQAKARRIARRHHATTGHSVNIIVERSEYYETEPT